MTQKISNPAPTYPKPKAPPAPPKVNSGSCGITNVEVHEVLALILIELQKINERLDEVIKDCEAGALDVPHLPDLMYREDKSISL